MAVGPQGRLFPRAPGNVVHLNNTAPRNAACRCCHCGHASHRSSYRQQQPSATGIQTTSAQRQQQQQREYGQEEATMSVWTHAMTVTRRSRATAPSQYRATTDERTLRRTTTDRDDDAMAYGRVHSAPRRHVTALVVVQCHIWRIGAGFDAAHAPAALARRIVLQQPSSGPRTNSDDEAETLMRTLLQMRSVEHATAHRVATTA